MDEPENIRNIAIAAHVDHGKCVSGDARVSLADGPPLPARELFEDVRETGEPRPDEDEAYEPSEPLGVASFDRTEDEMVAADIEYACRREADDPLVALRTSNGHVMETTPEHRYLVLTERGVMEFERADGIEEGDVVVGARKTPARSSGSAKTGLLRELATDYGFYVDVTGTFAERIDAHDRDALYEATDSELKRDSFDHAIWRGQFRLRDIVSVCESFDIPLADLYESVESLNYRGSDRRGEHSSLAVDLPDDLEPLFYLAGAFFGDGDVQGSITNDDPEMKALIEESADALGLETIVREFDERGDRIEVGGKTLTRLLQAAFEYPAEEKSASIRVPEFVFEADRAHAAAFVRGYMDADGTVEENRSAVSVYSASPGMLEDLQLLLYQFDVASKLNRSNTTLYVSGQLSLANFAEIGFGLSRKQERFETLLDAASAADVDRVPISGETLREVREDVGATQTDIFESYDSYETDHVGLTKQSVGRVADRFAQLDEDPTDVRIERLQRLARADTSFV
ncbi:MAG: intein-containing elongation factor EF-2, partial [Halobacteriales archaeon SW_9_67_25]